MSSANEIEIGLMDGARDEEAFRLLNEEWITRHFALEPKDRETLGDPQGTILAKGGCVLMARMNGEPMGCVALLVPMERWGDGAVEDGERGRSCAG